MTKLPISGRFNVILWLQPRISAHCRNYVPWQINVSWATNKKPQARVECFFNVISWHDDAVNWSWHNHCLLWYDIREAGGKLIDFFWILPHSAFPLGIAIWRRYHYNVLFGCSKPVQLCKCGFQGNSSISLWARKALAGGNAVCWMFSAAWRSLISGNITMPDVFCYSLIYEFHIAKTSSLKMFVCGLVFLCTGKKVLEVGHKTAVFSESAHVRLQRTIHASISCPLLRCGKLWKNFLVKTFVFFKYSCRNCPMFKWPFVLTEPSEKQDICGVCWNGNSCLWKQCRAGKEASRRLRNGLRPEIRQNGPMRSLNEQWNVIKTYIRINNEHRESFFARKLSAVVSFCVQGCKFQNSFLACHQFFFFNRKRQKCETHPLHAFLMHLAVCVSKRNIWKTKENGRNRLKRLKTELNAGALLSKVFLAEYGLPVMQLRTHQKWELIRVLFLP